ncbi:hypothetical protein A5710_00940 [Mycolicibacter sinensis]|uniref:AB hydrolase-1 domain-containing protein n=1 Tax=Mycolicibacter sinensis (strain JDM601) TaxID=875328 RepID=A0A1A2XEQ5_MYCSD|nr:hypothetical protein A5710_00940 [Mycolicibacter sinensis]
MGRALRRSVRHHVVVAGDGVRLAVCDRGPVDASRTVVLLHGLCLSRQSWSGPVRYLRDLLGPDVRIISYDHRGHGRSDTAPMATYRLDRLADDLAEVLACLAVGGEVTLAGHSLGGMVALTYCTQAAQRYQIQPTGLVLVATAAGHLADYGLGRLLATRGPSLLAALAAHAPAGVVEHAVRAVMRPLCQVLGRCHGCGADERESLCGMCESALRSTGLTTVAGFLAALRHYDRSALLGQVQARATVVSGGADVLTPPAHSRVLAAGIRGAEHRHFPWAGHMLLHERAREVAEAIAATVGARAVRPVEVMA